LFFLHTSDKCWYTGVYSDFKKKQIKSKQNWEKL
jgi:hypothetical protein